MVFSSKGLKNEIMAIYLLLKIAWSELILIPNPWRTFLVSYRREFQGHTG